MSVFSPEVFAVYVLSVLICLTGCVSAKDPAIVGRSADWYRHTDPHGFFESERKRGAIYFIGIYDRKLGTESPVPGISKHDPQFSPSRTWFAPSNSIADPVLNQQFRDAVAQFARRYNSLVLKYIKSPSITFRITFEKEVPQTRKMQVRSSPEILYVSNIQIIADKDIVSAKLVHGALGPQILTTLTAEGAKRMHHATESNLGKRLGIVVDDKLISAPIILQATDGNQFTINTGTLSQSEIERLATRISDSVNRAKP